MDAVDTSRVRALDGAASALERKGHFARAAEKYGQAVEAAKALAQPDCLVVAALQLACVNVLTCTVSGAASPNERAAAMAQLFAHQDAALATLQRRLAAGTLLRGRCRPYEVAWYDAHNDLINDGKSGKPPSAAGKAEWATLVGLETLLRGVNNILPEVLYQCQRSSSERERQRCALVVAALDAMTARMDDDAAAAAAAMGRTKLLFTSNMSRFMTAFRDAMARRELMPDTAGGALLAAAWARLLATGALASMGASADAHAAEVERLAAARHAARHAAAAAPECRTCALSGCGAREVHAAQFKSCAACREVVYCCREHQVADWSNHKGACKAAGKAKRAAA